MLNLTKIQLTSNTLFNWLLQDKQSSLEGQPQFVRDIFFDHLEHVFNLPHVSSVQAVQLSNFNTGDYDSTCMKAAVPLRNAIFNSGLFSYFLIHGSTADLGVVDGWSDFDSIAVVRRDALEAGNREHLFNTCKEIDTIMRRTDPHQHHGIHFVHEDELKSFPNLYLPVSLLGDCKCLLGSKKISVAQVNSQEFEMQRFLAIVRTLTSASREGVLRHHAKDDKYLLENYADSNTMYQLKYFLCLIMLMPVLWLNLKGIYCDKPTSFVEIKEFFSPNELEILTKASTIRGTWLPEMNLENVIPDTTINILGSNYLMRGAEYAARMRERL